MTTTTLLDWREHAAVATDYFAGACELADGDRIEAYHRVASGIHLVSTAIRQAERAGIDRAEITEAVAGARAWHAESPFVHRMQTWPRGYPGDYETVEYLCDATNRAEPGTVGHSVEQYTLRSSAPAQQHRNKIKWQSARVAATLARRPEARILSIACGGSRDMLLAAPAIAASRAMLVLNDVDEEALELSRTRLEPTGAALELVTGNVMTAVRRFGAHAPYDLVLFGGLCDYLADRQIAWLLKQVAPMVSAGGTICLTNIAEENLYRVWMEYMASWTLIERDEPTLRAIVAEAGLAGERCTITREESGLAYLVEIGV